MRKWQDWRAGWELGFRMRQSSPPGHLLLYCSPGAEMRIWRHESKFKTSQLKSASLAQKIASLGRARN